MSFLMVTVAGVGLAGASMSADAQSDAADNASDAQVQAAQLGVDEQRYQFDEMKAMLSPYADAGGSALISQMNLLGTNGQEAQQAAVSGIENGAQFQSMAQQGENAILQNASATGGLRGGNTQAALGQFRPAMLNDLINQQYQRLGGMTSMGQNAAAGVGNAGMQTGNNIANLMQQQGAAQAGNYIAQGEATAGLINNATGAFGTFMGGKF